VQLLWASPRELLNVFHAESSGCHIITATPDILAKLALVGKDLEQYSIETVKMFYNDAQSAGYRLSAPDGSFNGTGPEIPADRTPSVSA
jgi:transaldolase